MNGFEEKGYIAQEWAESKVLTSSAKDIIELSGGGKLEMFELYMLHHYVGYDGVLRVVSYPYEHIATYRTGNGGRTLTLYTKELYRMVELDGKEEICERVLSFVTEKLLPLEEYIVSVYGASGKLLYPKKVDPHDFDDYIKVYENYLRTDSSDGVKILRYEDVRTVEIGTTEDIGSSSFAVCGDTAFGGYTFAMMFFWGFDNIGIQGYLKVIQKQVFKKQKKLIVIYTGYGSVVSKPFYREKGEKPLEKPMVLCEWLCNASLITFYSDRFTVKRYISSKDTPSGEEITVPYESVKLVSCKSMRGYGGLLLYEVVVMAEGVAEPVTVRTHGKDGQEGYKHMIDLLKKYAPKAIFG